MSNVYSTNRYDVESLDEPMTTDGMEHQPLNYSIRNTSTNVVETYATFLHIAMEIADQLTDSLDERSPIADISHLTQVQ